MKTLRTLGLDDLRAERLRLSDEVTRLTWLRRLVVARRDLDVARLVGMTPLPGELPADVCEALALRPPGGGTDPDTLRRLADCARLLANATAAAQWQLDEVMSELVGRFAADPSGCLTGRPAR